jgi:cysteine-rich repeat protein
MNGRSATLLAPLSALVTMWLGCTPDCPPEQVAVHDQRRTRTLCVAALGSGSTDGSSTGTSSTTDTTGSTTAELPACGDGVQQADEECDDGNTVDGDGCSADCKLEPPTCGDGGVEGTEECDDGNPDDNDACNSMCKAASCGDGVVWVEMEECDDGNQDDTDACTNLCTAATCGDGLVQAGMEECDDGNQVDTDDCSNDCKAPVCGDDVVAGSEACDDGNQVNTDDCVACQLAACGDGHVHAGVEACDDGNLVDFDGCSQACAHEYLMFATTELVPPDFGGVAGADGICAAAAAAWGNISGTYVAWVSVGGDDASSDLPTGNPLIRRDGQTIVPDAKDLTKGAMTQLQNPINLDQNGKPVSGYAWTGTGSHGAWSGLDCLAWTSTSHMEGANIGSLNATNAKWAGGYPPIEDIAQFYCNAKNHIYCFRKPDP